MNLEKEAIILGNYLIGRNINRKAIDLYKSAVVICQFRPGEKEMKLELIAFKNPFFLGFIDGGMALTSKEFVLRKKIYLMLAILETIPEYTMFYTSRINSKVYFVKMIFISFRGVYRGLLGVLFLKIFLNNLH